ncbi:MAG: type I toxin-antitoxin system SymE family toxin [Lachnospiraceae bacterium]|nr:type I toxin-antitoxin system SymE family toxin [Lachnospiraceae bacterium]
MAGKKCRSLKVYEQSGYNYKPTPSIHLQGQWLKEIGFESGKYIQVKCEEGKLVITLDEARERLVEAETEFMESEGAQLDMWYQQEKEKRFAQFVAERKVRYNA